MKWSRYELSAKASRKREVEADGVVVHDAPGLAVLPRGRPDDDEREQRVHEKARQVAGSGLGTDRETGAVVVGSI